MARLFSKVFLNIICLITDTKKSVFIEFLDFPEARGAPPAVEAVEAAEATSVYGCLLGSIGS